MKLREEFDSARTLWPSLTLYGKFEHAIILLLTTLIAVVIAAATWHLTWNIGALLVLGAFDPANPAFFQTIFGMIFTVIIALEFKHTLLVILYHLLRDGTTYRELGGVRGDFRCYFSGPGRARSASAASRASCLPTKLAPTARRTRTPIPITIMTGPATCSTSCPRK